MDLIRNLIIVIAGLLLTSNIYAAIDPIGWTTSGGIPGTTSLNNSYSTTVTIKSNLPFTMPTPIRILNNSTPRAEVSLIDECSGLRLAHNQTCNVGMVLIPKSAGAKNLSFIVEYGKTRVAVPHPAIISSTPGQSAASLQGVMVAGLPTAVLNNTTYNLNFQFINNTGSTLSSLTLTPNPSNPAAYTQGSVTNCTTLAPGGTCIITGSLNTSATSGNLSVGYTLSSGPVSASLISSSIVSTTLGAGVRTFTFVNNCGVPIWFGMVSSNVSGGGCKTNANCPYPSICNPQANKGVGYCFYPAPLAVNA